MRSGSHSPTADFLAGVQAGPPRTSPPGAFLLGLSKSLRQVKYRMGRRLRPAGKRALRSALPFSLLLAGCVTGGVALAPPALANGLQLDSRIVWNGDLPGFGAYSALAVTGGGTAFLTVSDKGRWVRGRLVRDADGRLAAAEATADGPLRDPDGAPVGRYDVDAESLAFDAAGRTLVAFEANHRVWAYADLAGSAAPLPGSPILDRLQNNSGLEAIFTGPDGTLHGIPERSGELDRPFPVYRLGPGGWSTVFTLPRRPPYLVTGADLGPDGRLYLLERHWNGFLSFAARIRSFRYTARGLSDERTEWEGALGSVDNLEGISTWRDGAGVLRVTVISDDNRMALQRTLILEFRRAILSAPRPRPRPG